jgi:hypothetical protein
MWFRTEKQRVSSKPYVLEFKRADKNETESVRTLTDARRQAEELSDTLKTDVIVWGEDSKGKFQVAVASCVDDAASSEASPLIKQLYQQSLETSLTIKDRLMLELDPEHIKGIAHMFSAIKLFAKQFGDATQPRSNRIPYRLLQKSLTQHLEYHYAHASCIGVLAGIVSSELRQDPAFKTIDGLNGLGNPDKEHFDNGVTPQPMLLEQAGEKQVMDFVSLFVGLPPGAKTPVVLLFEGEPTSYGGIGNVPAFLGMLYAKADEAVVVPWLHKLTTRANPYKNQTILVGRKTLRTIKPTFSRPWGDVVLPPDMSAELHLIEQSIMQKETLDAKGLSIKRGLLLSSRPGCGKSAAIQSLTEALHGKCSILLVESFESVRQLYEFAASIAPAVVVLEDLDLITTNRTDYDAVRDNTTGELLQVLSGTTEYGNVLTVATTNHPEKIDPALANRAGRFDAHVRMKEPTKADKLQILNIHLRRYQVPSELAPLVIELFEKELASLPIVGADIDEFVRVGVKRGLLHPGTMLPEDFKPGAIAIKSLQAKQPSNPTGFGASA